MASRWSAVALALSAAFALGACSDSPEEKATADCGAVWRAVSDVPQTLERYKKSGGTTTLSAVVLTSDELDQIHDPELKKLAEQGASLANRLNETKDPAVQNQIVTQTKQVFEAFRKKCDGWIGTTAQHDELSQILAAGKVPEPDKHAPITGTTPEGTTVKLGEPVLVKYTDYEGRQGKVKFTVTEVAPLSSSDFLRINRNKRNSYGPIKYLRFTVEVMSDDRPYEAQPNVIINPEFSFGTSDDQLVSTLTFSEPFDSCKNTTGNVASTGDFCRVIEVPKRSTLKTVGVTTLDKSHQKPPGTTLYRWTVG
ncbi:hypothetical protein GII33_17130 [Gordonia pseudamarae]|uniref:Lipoprotein n=1 Tax=Gordonia pseudamarae TaxID=2831662 RepID=A0ABX6IKI5_9ACTN|nr:MULTISPECIES: hypothetical protein [Gordonia]MBD0024427.1 hypothetical protein [Gordonia sp. (in: high G+C Gram-positive bacteria)]QHN27416.1 hypothetical protein GII33_17130 [Gordonia pseudamarae]QHN36300.1 hypothetical protein GII31_16905 [Gordonia pseudamarae]